LVRCFSEDLTATQTARLAGLSVRSVNTIFLRMRRRLAEECEAQSPYSGVVEVDESYFGPQRVRGKKGRGAGGKTIVFGVFQRGENVYTQIVPDCKKATLQRVIRGRVSLESVIHSDGWRGYDGLVDMGYQKHFRVKHRENEFADRSNHINGIEAFWSFAKRRLAKFNGLHHHTFYLHLKECEYRFNHRQQDLYQVLLRLLREHPL
jgi:transposase-like protein